MSGSVQPPALSELQVRTETLKLGLKASLASAIALAAPGYGQTPAPPDAQPTQDDALYEEEDGEEIVVTGVRRGSVIGDVPPENQLDPRDIRATGASDITELLEALGPQIGSARGRGGERPILLLNGQRISSFRELRDIPTEAIARVDILPEEVALKYGYRADQRVVNIVLRQRFRSTATRVEGRTATEGGYVGGLTDITRLQINRDGRTTVNLRAEGNSPLSEGERDIARATDASADERSARSLIGSRRLVRGSATINRTVFGDVGATLNTEVEHSEGRSLLGLGDIGLEPLARETNSTNAHVGLTLNGNQDRWRWSVTGNGDAARAVTRTQRDTQVRSDRARTLTTSGDLDLMANGPLFALPAGEANFTVRVGASTLARDSNRRRADLSSSVDLERTRGSASANLDLPVSRRNRDFSALGNLTLNGNAEVEQLSDFGTLTTLGAGANWSPLERLNLLGSWTREEGAPSIAQLGDPIFETPGTRLFDFTSGETVLVSAITGGNPDLLADRRNVIKLGGNWKPFEETDVTLRGEYVRTRIDNPVSSFPGPSAALEAAFPERVERDASGRLVRVDLRPINYDEARRDTLRWGFDFTKSLRSARPSQAAIERFRAMRGTQSGPPSGAQGPPPRGGGGRGGGGVGRFLGGGRQGGRRQFSLTPTLNRVAEVTIRPGLAQLDYLGGDALGQTGGRPRATRSRRRPAGSTTALSAPLGRLAKRDTGRERHRRRSAFSPLATFHLRAVRQTRASASTWSRSTRGARGASVRFEVRNLLDAKPRVAIRRARSRRATSRTCSTRSAAPSRSRCASCSCRREAFRRQRAGEPR